MSTPLEQQVVSVLSQNREDSFATQRKRGYVLAGVARSLHERFGLQKWANVGAKHVAFIVETWKSDDAGRRSIEEKLSHLRWLVRKIGKANLLPKSNKELGIEAGPRHTRAGKTISSDTLARMLADVKDDRIRAMILLARYTGLRFREAALFRPWRDWDGSRIWVKRGTKGGRPRYLWPHNSRQVEALDRARLLARGEEGLVPPACRTFDEWRQHVYRELRAAGIGRATDRTFHDLRRTYIVERMRFLVTEKGMDPPRAAALVSREVGHHRLEILRWYLAEGDIVAAA